MNKSQPHHVLSTPEGTYGTMVVSSPTDAHRMTRTSVESVESSSTLGLSLSPEPTPTSAYTRKAMPHPVKGAPLQPQAVVVPPPNTVCSTTASMGFFPVGRDVMCDKCKQLVRGGDFRMHNRLCLGKLCNRCHAPVVGSYEEHKALCTSRRCDRCGLIPSGSFTAHNKMCKALTVSPTASVSPTSPSPNPPTDAATAAPPAPIVLVKCGTCLGLYDPAEEEQHAWFCGVVCCYCKRAYGPLSWEDHLQRGCPYGGMSE